MAVDPVNAALDHALLDRYPAWGGFSEEARRLIPSGVAHDSRYAGGGPVLPVFEAKGPRKRDRAGNEFVDYWMGHGSLILGHGNAEVVEAVRGAAGRMTHAGGCHELEHDWARLVTELVPSAEKVRFTMSGTEAVMLSLRIARAHTGRERVLKLHGHFHGWSDFTLLAIEPPFGVPSGGGWSRGAAGSTFAVPGEPEAVEDALSTKDFAALILEPTGGSGGAVPLDSEKLARIAQIARRLGTLVIFDEVVTGFRVAPGGAQEKTGVLPDLTVLGKVLAGGLPGAAVAGPAEIMGALDFTGDGARDRTRRVAHWGTFNANPLSAAAGTACLRQIKDGEPIRRSEEFAEGLRRELNKVFKEDGIPWCMYGADSVLHLNTAAGPCPDFATCDRSTCLLPPEVLKRKRPTDLRLKKALWLEGVDWPGTKQAWTSQTHGDAEVARTAEAFRGTARRLRELGAEL